ncbi:phosphotransferase family protein [Pseudomonas capeferrum]|uniref:phosphotransferase family protein n=1 Tax=Pseudomonas capeferrum TaxID=1495066 RepID=UPI0015E42361|nr:phosphotransferase family protein [Pseudomonas capeferrum]MBA1204279.1 phosphotransferase family protein [Pseudomonas capeferrum]
MTATLPDFDGLLDWAALAPWIEAAGLPGSGPVTAVSQLSGGSQNNLFLMQRGTGRFVLRRPPRHLRGNSNETMAREARVLAALAGSAVPHPRLLAASTDGAVMGMNFYAMEPLEGFSPAGPLQGRYATDATWRRCMGEAFVSAAAALGALDYKALGLDGFGRPNDWHSRQVERWRSQLEGYRQTPGYSETALPEVDLVERWLNDNLPTDRRIGIIHGDYQWPNVMFSLEAPRISGLIDWELSTLGDPLLDLAWVLTSWREPGDPEGGVGANPVVQPWADFMSRADLINLYGQLSGRDMLSMPWFFVLACYKLACLLEGTYARSLVGKAPREMGAYLHDYARWLMAKARQLIAAA